MRHNRLRSADCYIARQLGNNYRKSAVVCGDKLLSFRGFLGRLLQKGLPIVLALLSVEGEIKKRSESTFCLLVDFWHNFVVLFLGF